MAAPWEAYAAAPAAPAADGPWSKYTTSVEEGSPGILPDIGSEISKSFTGNLDAVKKIYPDPINRGGIQGIMDTGRGLLAIPGMALSPLTGTVRAVGGAAFKGAVDSATSGLQSVFGGKREDIPLDIAKDNVETAFMAARPGRAGPTPAVAPTVAELKTASRAGYNHPTVAAVEIDPASVSNLSTKIENDLLKRGFRARNEPAVFDEVKALVPSKGVASVSVADLDSARKALGLMARERDSVGQFTPKATAARHAADEISDYLPNISKADVIAGDPVAASAIMRDAQSNWGAAKRAEQVDLQLTRAERQAAKSGSGGNVENSMRQKIATILDNPKRTVGYNAPERQAMEDIVRGTRGRNALRMAGKVGVDGGLSLMLNAGAAMGTGGATIPITAAGTIARILGQRSTARAGRDLSEMVRGRSALHGAAAPIGPTPTGSALIPYQAPAGRVPYQAIMNALMQQQQQQGSR